MLLTCPLLFIYFKHFPFFLDDSSRGQAGSVRMVTVMSVGLLTIVGVCIFVLYHAFKRRWSLTSADGALHTAGYEIITAAAELEVL